MTKKLIITSLLLLLVVSPALAAEKTKSGILPDSPLYFFEKIGENIKSALTFNKQEKIVRFINLADERLVETRAMLNKSKPEIVGKVIGSCEKLLQKATEITQKIENEETKKELLDKIKTKFEAKNEFKKEFLANLKSESENKLTVAPDRNVLPLTDTTSPEYVELPQYTIEVEDEKESLFDKIKAFFGKKDEESDSPIAVVAPDSLGDNEPIVALAPQTGDGGKPGMNEEGSTQVARSEGVGSCNSKLYLCQIDCGRKIVENCVLYSGTYMYQMLNCRGDCTKFNIFYGCGMEAGCDEPCWNDYYSHCGTGAYENCLTDCEETFAN